MNSNSISMRFWLFRSKDLISRYLIFMVMLSACSNRQEECGSPAKHYADTVESNRLVNKAREFNEKNADSSILYARNALSIANNNIASSISKVHFVGLKNKAQACHLLSNGHFNKSNFILARHYGDTALRYWDSVGNSKEKAKTIGLYANICNEQRDFASALRAYQGAIDIGRKFKDTISLAIRYINISFFYIGQNRFNDALASIDSSNKWTDLINVHNNLHVNPLKLKSSNLSIKGQVYSNLNDLFDAKNCFERALNIDVSLKDSMMIQKSQCNLACCYFFIGKNTIINGDRSKGQFFLAKADSLFAQAYQMANRIGDPQGLASDIGGLGSLYIFLGRFPEAKTCLKRALAISDSIQDPTGLIIWNEELSNLDTLQLNYFDAYKHYKESRRWKDITLNRDSIEAVANAYYEYYYRCLHSSDSTNNAIIQHDKDETIQRINGDRVLLIALGSMVFFAAIISFVLFIRHRRFNYIMNHIMRKFYRKYYDRIDRLKGIARGLPEVLQDKKRDLLLYSLDDFSREFKKSNKLLNQHIRTKNIRKIQSTKKEIVIEFNVLTEKIRLDNLYNNETKKEIESLQSSIFDELESLTQIASFNVPRLKSKTGFALLLVISSILILLISVALRLWKRDEDLNMTVGIGGIFLVVLSSILVYLDRFEKQFRDLAPENSDLIN